MRNDFPATLALSLDTLRLANIKRLPQFRDKHGRIAHSRPDGSDWNPAQWLQALIGELGEYANFRKKFERGDLTFEEFKPHAAKELADVLTYLDLLALRCLDTPTHAHRTGIDLSVAAVEKFNEVSDRVKSTVRIGCNAVEESSDFGEVMGVDLHSVSVAPGQPNCHVDGLVRTTLVDEVEAVRLPKIDAQLQEINALKAERDALVEEFAKLRNLAYRVLPNGGYYPSSVNHSPGAEAAWRQEWVADANRFFVSQQSVHNLEDCLRWLPRDVEKRGVELARAEPSAGAAIHG